MCYCSFIKESLLIRQSILGLNDRCVAETHYQLGTTYAVSGDLDQASAAFRCSVDCLKLHAKELENKLSGLSNDTDEYTLISSTLGEVNNLVSDVERRIADIEEDRLVESVKLPENQATDFVEKTDKPASDITHLVRKKRVNVENGKDSVVENGVNGDVDSSVSKKAKLIGENDVLATNGVHQ